VERPLLDEQQLEDLSGQLEGLARESDQRMVPDAADDPASSGLPWQRMRTDSCRLGCSSWPGVAGAAVRRRERPSDSIVLTATSRGSTSRCSAMAWVSMKFRDSDGKMRHVPARDARLLFTGRSRCCSTYARRPVWRPNSARNDEYYWLWIEPEVRKLWIGRWAQLAVARRLAIRPTICSMP